LHLEALACLPQHYFILEVSADLQQRQKLTLQELCPHLLSRVEWLAALPHEPIAAIVFANEVLDAMPVERFRVSAAGLEQWMIIAKEGQLVSCYQPSDHVLTEFTTASLPLGYEFEINFQAQAWINSLYACFSSVVILLIDYGYGESEYFDPGRVGGTLACYYRHRQHDDPLQLIGLQDISAQINFTSLAQAAVAVGFDVLGFTNQAAFLLANGILTLLDQTSDAIAFNQQQQIKQLLLPTQMGEQFKVLALGKNFTEPLQGFSLLDLLWKL
jgi:SAM-dependent MidA family methyltransferase